MITTYLANHRIVLNGTIHTDETAIGGLRKYNRGRFDLPDTHWLFGLVDRANHECYFQFIEDKSHKSILPIIEEHVTVGSTIHSDGALFTF